MSPFRLSNGTARSGEQAVRFVVLATGAPTTHPPFLLGPTPRVGRYAASDRGCTKTPDWVYGFSGMRTPARGAAALRTRRTRRRMGGTCGSAGLMSVKTGPSANQYGPGAPPGNDRR